MEKVSRIEGRKSNARKAAAKANKPVIDVPNGASEEINSYIEKNSSAITSYLTNTFEEISEKDVKEIVREAAECAVLKRSPKVGGAWGDDTTIIEDVLKATENADPVAADEDEDDLDKALGEGPGEPVPPAADEEADLEDEVDHGEEPLMDDPESHHGDADEDQDLQAQETKKPKMFKNKTKKAKATKPAKKATAKKAAKPKAKAVPAKKEAKPKTAEKKEVKARTGKVSADSIKSLKGKDQFIAAAKVLKSNKKIWIQAQDIPEVVGHLYEVSIGKAKLKEEGFDGKGEKVYRKARLVGMKEQIEAFIKSAK